MSQQQAIDALTRVTINSGRQVGWVVQSGADRIMLGRFLGDNQPIIHVAANGIATMGTATVKWGEQTGYLLTNIVLR